MPDQVSFAHPINTVLGAAVPSFGWALPAARRPAVRGLSPPARANRTR